MQGAGGAITSRAMVGGGMMTTGAMAGAGTMTLGGGPGAGMRLHGPGYSRSLLFGVVFAAGWSPCIGPILGGIIGLASTTGSVAQGTVLLLAYAAGLAVPFLAVAMGATWVARRLGWVGRHHRVVSLVSGAMLDRPRRSDGHQPARASRGVDSAARRLTEAHEWHTPREPRSWRRTRCRPPRRPAGPAPSTWRSIASGACSPR